MTRKLSYLVLLLVAAIQLAPFVFMVGTSFKPPSELYQIPMHWMPQHPTAQNYDKVLNHELSPLRGTLNTLMIAIPATVGGLFTSALAGFAFAKMRFRWREQIFGVLLGTMMLPGIIMLIPQFILFARIHWIDTYLPLIVPGALGAPFAIFMTRQFFRQIPDELIDAARLDGCTPWQTFWKIIIPISGPVLATLAVFGFKGAWNDYFGPLIYISSPEKFNIQQMIAATQNAYGGEPAVLMAASALALLPLVVLFFLAQRYFVEGIASTGLKG